MATNDVIAKLEINILEGICKTLANAVSHAELSRAFKEIKLIEAGGNPKWERMLLALRSRQDSDNHGNNTIRLICFILNPVRYLNTLDLFKETLTQINKYLAFIGIRIGDDGKPNKTERATTILEAEERANSLRSELRRRHIHSDVLYYCKAELLDKNYFHCILEATKSIAQKIRDKTNIELDGAALCDAVFSITNPILALNTLQTESEQSQQKGFSNFLKGIFGMYRNVTSHSPKILWAIYKKDAIDALTIISYAHRQIDEAIIVPKNIWPNKNQ